MNTDTPDVSIVVPSYNSACWLPEALESTRHIGIERREVIVVDDGSTDETCALLEKLQGTMPELKVLRQPNGGVAMARNTGMDAASGRWLLFLDADDILYPNSLSGLLVLDADMVRLGVEELHLDGSVELHNDEPSRTSTGVAYLQSRLEKRSFYEPCWAYAYRREWLKASGLSFVPGLVHEDMLFTPQALCAAGGVAVLGEVCYEYRRVTGSITTAVDRAKRKRRLGHLQQVVNHLIHLGNQHAEVDIWLWAARTIDYATTLVEGSRTLGMRVLAMEWALFSRFTAWGRFRTRRAALHRLRWGLEFALLGRRAAPRPRPVTHAS